jgi:hypothetical protein
MNVLGIRVLRRMFSQCKSSCGTHEIYTMYSRARRVCLERVGGEVLVMARYAPSRDGLRLYPGGAVQRNPGGPSVATQACPVPYNREY